MVSEKQKSKTEEDLNAAHKTQLDKLIKRINTLTTQKDIAETEHKILLQRSSKCEVAIAQSADEMFQQIKTLLQKELEPAEFSKELLQLLETYKRRDLAKFYWG